MRRNNLSYIEPWYAFLTGDTSCVTPVRGPHSASQHVVVVATQRAHPAAANQNLPAPQGGRGNTSFFYYGSTEGRRDKGASANEIHSYHQNSLLLCFCGSCSFFFTNFCLLCRMVYPAILVIQRIAPSVAPVELCRFPSAVPVKSRVS